MKTWHAGMRIGFLFALCCVSPAAAAAQSSSLARAEPLDSLILERTSCLGTCPAYRLTIQSTGRVIFQSHNRDEAGRSASDTGGARVLAGVAREIARVRFFELPAMEVGKAPFCRTIRTDAPSISVSVFGPSRNKVLAYYTGCLGDDSSRPVTRSALARLRSLADSIDAIAGATRWIRPSSCCGGIDR